ncbi:membrane protein [Mycolicibacter kumamotonensis]|uniref:Membrane protein n=2 Tax=Mycolicibacter kumamotonensis TaxID=354243 RepID=A0A1B8SKF0_9MYCO|nr:membrane protein [Mycolicibacter kumamotonensis]
MPRASSIIAVAMRQTSGTRAKDSDRDDTCRILDAGLAEGQLTSEEHRERVSAATRAVTLGDLHDLVTDLQTASAPTQLPVLVKPLRLGSRGIALAALAAAGLLGIGIGWGLYGNTSSPFDFTSDPGAKPDGITPVVLTPPRQLHSLGGLTGLLEQARQKFGDTIGYRLVIYPDYASLTRPDPAEQRRELNYTYRGGWDDPSTSAKSSDAVAVDLSRFDPKATVGILRGAPETLGIKPSDVKSTYLIIEPARDPTAPGELSLSVYVSSDYGGGYIAFAGDGAVKRINYPS